MSKWRWPSWAILAWAGLAIVVTVAMIATADNSYSAGRQTGQLTWVWIIGFVVLGVVWKQTQKGKVCPRCGLNVAASVQSCPRCGYYPGMPMGPMPGGPPQTPGGPPSA